MECVTIALTSFKENNKKKIEKNVNKRNLDYKRHFYYLFKKKSMEGEIKRGKKIFFSKKKKKVFFYKI